MKHCVKNIILIAAMPLVCFCAKNDEFTQSGSGEIVKISAGLPETKVSLTPGTDPALALAWEDNDQIVVEGTSSSTFTLSEIVDAHKATFEGTAVTGSEFAVYYPSKDILTRSYEGQVQDGNASAEHLVYNAMVDGLSSYDSFTFNKVNGAIKLVVKVPSSVTEVSAISITSQTSAGVDQAVFYKTNDAEGEKTATLSLGFIEGTAPAEGVLTAYAMVSWNEVELAEGSRLAIKLTVPDKQCSYQKTIKVTTATTVAGGQTFIIDLSDANALKHVIAGKGTQSDPYLLYDCEDLLCIRPILEKNIEQYQYFRLENDIDMSSITNWLPLNDANIKNTDVLVGGKPKEYCGYIYFDGNNKTLSNLKCTDQAYSGFFGVLVGTVKDLTFDKAVISTKSSGCGVLGGYIGISDGRYGKAENITINNSTVTYNGAGANCAIAFGSAGKADINNIDIKKSTLTFGATTNTDKFIGAIIGSSSGDKTVGYQCNISNCDCDADVKIINNGSVTLKGIGGIAGNIGHADGEVMENCTFRGGITPGSATQYVGGIVGIVWVSASNYSSTLKNCSNYAAINAPNCTNIGGITGYMQKGAITDCHNYGKVTGKGTQGGIVGQCEKAVNVSRCSNNADIETSGNNIGGIVGNYKEGTIDQCWYSGNLTVKDNSGGIAGVQGTSSTSVIIENCYTTGTITNSGSQKCGGIAGECYQNSKIRNCYSTMSISGGGRVFGSIAGRFNNNQWSGSQTTDFNMEVTNCIAAGSINSTASDANLGSSGAVLGSCPVKVAHYTNCWRIYNFTYNVKYATTGVGLVDQGYTVTNFTTGTNLQSGYTTNPNWYPYHASEATTTALQTAYSGWTTSKTDAQITVSDIAAATNHSDSNAWKSDIWDFSGDYPTLKNNPEPTE